MADKIAVMNEGVIEQLATPREIYDRPASMFVADFIGSPPMNFLSFSAGLPAGADAVEIEGARIAMPALREAVPNRDLVLGARPEHVRFTDSSPLRGEVFGVEYLGTTQIVTLVTRSGRLKARLSSEIPARIGETVGLALRPEKLSLFDKASGKALRSALHDAAAQTRSAAMEARHG